MEYWGREHHLPIGSNWSRQNCRSERVIAAASGTALLYRGRSDLLSEKLKNAVCGTISRAGTFDDSGSRSDRTFRLPSADRLLIPPIYVDTARKILKEVPFDFVLLRPSLAVCAERAASRREGAISDYAMLKSFYTRFEEGTVEPIGDDHANPESLAHRIADGLNQGRFRVR